MPRLITSIGAVSALIVLAAGCGSAKATARSRVEKPDLTVAVVPAAGPAGLYIAQAKGFFTQAGLHVKIENVTSGSDAIADLVNGSVDVDQGQWTSDIAAVAAGVVKLHALAAGNAGAPGVEQISVLPSSGITSVQQLAGKTIAVNALQGLPVYMTDTVLAEHGMSPSMVHFVAIPFPAMGNALTSHRVDAAFMIEPYATEAEDQDGLEPLADMDQGPTEEFPLTGYVATQAWTAKYPRTAAAFTRALARGQQLAATSRLDVEKALIKYTTISKQTAAVMATGTFPQSVTTAALIRVAGLMQREHGFRPGVKVNVSHLAQEMTR
jgi:NitT/TauT family transport system substrate-binding protein